MAVHLGHLQVGNHNRNLSGGAPAVLTRLQRLPQLCAVLEHAQVGIPRLSQRGTDHLGQQDGVLRDPDRLASLLPLTHSIHLTELDTGLRRNLGHNLFKIQNRDQVLAALSDSGGNPVCAPGNRVVRLLDVPPRDTADPHYRMDAEGNVHFIEIGDNEEILFPFGFGMSTEILRQIHHGNHDVPGFKNPFHCRVGMGHWVHRRRQHNLTHLGHIDPVEISVNGKLHDLNLVCPRLQ